MADIGGTLREARMRARIDITEVESATKIRARYLRAIENEEWEALPGTVYVKSFLRTYGDYLGLDSRMLVDEFKRRYERPSDHEPRSVTTLHRERERAARGPLLPPWALIGLVLVGVVVVLFLVGVLFGGKSPKPSPPVVRTATTPQVKRPVHHHHAAARHATTVKLELVPIGRVYVCLVDGTGKRLIPGQIFAPGQSIPIQTGAKLLLTLGNNSVQMKLNGKTQPVAPSASSIGLELTPSGAHPLPLAKQPRCA